VNRSVIFYYRIVGYHKLLTGDGIPVNIKQLYDIVGTERKPNKYGTLLADRCVTYVKLGDILNFGSKQCKVEDVTSRWYPWRDLVKSVAKDGIRIPVILERLFVGGKQYYRVLEGKHRITACSMIEPFDRERLIPAILVDRDNVYTDYMRKQEHPKIGRLE